MRTSISETREGITLVLENVLVERRSRMSGRFSLQVPKLVLSAGSVTALVGPSGSGKTTVFNMVAGVEAGPLAAAISSSFQRQAYIMHESSMCAWRSVVRNVNVEALLRSTAYDSAELAEFCGRLGLSDDVLYKRSGVLSFGMRQRVEIAKALVFHPNLLVLDEGLSGLDRVSRKAALKLIGERVDAEGMAVLMTSHHAPDILALSDIVHRISDGIVSEGILVNHLPRVHRLGMSDVQLQTELDADYVINGIGREK